MSSWLELGTGKGCNVSTGRDLMEVRGCIPGFKWGLSFSLFSLYILFLYRKHICPALWFHKRSVFQWVQIVLVNWLQHAYEADFLLGTLKNKDRKLDQTFNSIFHVYLLLNKQLKDIDIYNVIDNFQHTKVQTQW